MLSLLAAKQALQRGQSSSRAREALRLGARKMMRGCIIFGVVATHFFFLNFHPDFFGEMIPIFTNMSFKWVGGPNQQLEI